MVRTQIYLTEQEQEALRKLAQDKGQSQSELIREAVDRYIDSHRLDLRLARLREGRGLWSERTDLPDFDGLRQELDR